MSCSTHVLDLFWLSLLDYCECEIFKKMVTCYILILQYIFYLEWWNEFSDRWQLVSSLPSNWFESMTIDRMRQLIAGTGRNEIKNWTNENQRARVLHNKTTAMLCPCAKMSVTKTCKELLIIKADIDSMTTSFINEDCVRVWCVESTSSDSIAYSISGQREWSSATVFKCYQTPDFHSEVLYNV